MSLLITGGEIVTDERRFPSDIYVADETITTIGVDLERILELGTGTDRIDATGKLIFPGFIDPHVHIHLPFMGTFAKDTYATASVAALLGGTTTIIEMACPSRAESTLEGYKVWKQNAEGKSACDYAFHMAVSHFGGETEDELRQIVADGTTSFKVFLAYKDFFGINDAELYQVLKLAAELGVVVTAHCENGELVSQLQQALLADSKTGPEWHEASRPEIVEEEGTRRFTAFLEVTGASGYIVHLSCARALSAAMEAKQRGVAVAIESVVPHLLLDKTYAARPGLEGLKYVMSPPLRDAANQAALWDGLASGAIDTVGTDHCPFDLEQKLMGKDAFTLIPNGIPGIEDRVHLMYTCGVSAGVLDIHRFVSALSTQPAKLLALYPRKGAVLPGSDADLVIYDPNYQGVISAATHHMNCDYSGYEGFPVQGRAESVIVRGRVQVRNGVFVGDPSHGQFLRRSPSRGAVTAKDTHAC